MLSGYLHDKAGKDVYSNVHSNWRKSLDMDPDEAVLLYDSVSDSFRKEIDEKYSYPSEISGLFKSEQEEWMSKMTLDFYINSLTMDMSGDEDKCHQVMVYSEVSPLDIEGGGRVIVAVDGDSYDVPADADDGLVYVGLDKNFKPTGVPLYK